MRRPEGAIAVGEEGLAAGGAGVEEVVVVLAGGTAANVLLFDAGREGDLPDIGLEVPDDLARGHEGYEAGLLEGDFEGPEMLAEGKAVGQGEVVDLVVGEREAIIDALDEGRAVRHGEDFVGAGDALAELVFGEWVAAAEEGEEGFRAGNARERGDAGVCFGLPGAALPAG